MYYYHVSKIKDLKTLKPSIPCNKMVKDYGEDGTIPRVCVSPNINQCLNALGGFFDFDETLYIYSIWCENAYKPSRKLVPDVSHTDEHWILEEIECKILYEIKMVKQT